MKPALLILALVASCATSTASSRQATLTTATVAINTLAKSVEAYDQVSGDAIIAKAVDKQTAVTELGKLRARVGVAIKVLTASLDAVAVANTLNDSTSLDSVKAALDQAIAAVTDLTGGKP